MVGHKENGKAKEKGKLEAKKFDNKNTKKKKEEIYFPLKQSYKTKTLSGVSYFLC